MVHPKTMAADVPARQPRRAACARYPCRIDQCGPRPIRTDYLLSHAHARACRTPLFRLPDEEVVFPFNVIRIPPSNDAATMQRMVAQNRALYDRIHSAGGIQYPVSAFPMSHDDWKNHFGSSWPRLAEIKRRYDPGNLLAPGYGIF
ncbi:BBE domain-containing protein [Bradyrhizobium sp. TZ2]